MTPQVEMSKKTSIVPFGWQRRIEAPTSTSSPSVIYISPSSAVLSSIVEVCQYLERSGTCKCGLQCPIHVAKVFSFNPEVQSVNLTKKGWCRQENKTESHRKNCQHWNALQKTQIGKKRALCHSELTVEPPPKLIIIRKDGQLRSVIPDNRKVTTAPTPTRKVSTISPLKSPLFESGTSATGVQSEKFVTKTKSDFKLQWIKAEDEVSQNEAESGNELCFSPDLKKSPPLSFPQSLISGLSEPSSLFKQGGRFGTANMTQTGALFVQGGNASGLPSLHGGIEPVHRFGMSAFPGTNFLMKNDPTSNASVQNPFPQEMYRRHPHMALKAEEGSQFVQSTTFGFSHNMGRNQPRGLLQPGAVEDPSGGIWQQNQNCGMTGNVNQMNSNMSGNISSIGPRGQIQGLRSPTMQQTPQRFPLGSPTMLNPTSPYGFQMGNFGQNAPLTSTDPSPFSNRSQSRSSSVGTPTPSPGAHWQGPRPQVPDYSRPLSRSSNATTPGPDASPSQIPQWVQGPGTIGVHAARNSGAVRGFTPSLSPGPTSPFPPMRLYHISNPSRLPLNPKRLQTEVSGHRLSLTQSASQQLRIHSQNVQQRTQQAGNLQSTLYQTHPARFGGACQFPGSSMVPPCHSMNKNAGLVQANVFRPSPPYHPTRIQFAQINETDNSTQPRFSFRPNQPHIRGMRYQGPMMQQRFALEQQWGQFPGVLTAIRPDQYFHPGMSHPGMPNSAAELVQQPPSKPKRTRRRRTKPPTKKANSQPPKALNPNFMSSEFPDLFGSAQEMTDKLTVPAVCTTDNLSSGLHKSDLLNVSKELSHCSGTVRTPSLVMPSSMHASQTGKDSFPTCLPLKPSLPENSVVTESLALKPPPIDCSSTQKDSVRGVTTPPLPVLSPTCLFDEVAAGDDEEFSDFASPSPAVFDFPPLISNQTLNASGRNTMPSDLPMLAKITSNSSLPLSIANVISTPIVTTIVKPQNAPSLLSADKRTSDVSLAATTIQVSGTTSMPTGLHSLRYRHQAVHRDSTALVSSSGEIFHLPRRPDVKLLGRRFSDHSDNGTQRPQSSVRRRIRSHPSYPSSVSRSDESIHQLRLTWTGNTDRFCTGRDGSIPSVAEQGVSVPIKIDPSSSLKTGLTHNVATSANADTKSVDLEPHKVVRNPRQVTDELGNNEIPFLEPDQHIENTILKHNAASGSTRMNLGSPNTNSSERDSLIIKVRNTDSLSPASTPTVASLSQGGRTSLPEPTVLYCNDDAVKLRTNGTLAPSGLQEKNPFEGSDRSAPAHEIDCNDKTRDKKHEEGVDSNSQELLTQYLDKNERNMVEMDVSNSVPSTNKHSAGNTDKKDGYDLTNTGQEHDQGLEKDVAPAVCATALQAETASSSKEDAGESSPSCTDSAGQGCSLEKFLDSDNATQALREMKPVHSLVLMNDSNCSPASTRQTACKEFDQEPIESSYDDTERHKNSKQGEAKAPWPCFRSIESEMKTDSSQHAELQIITTPCETSIVETDEGTVKAVNEELPNTKLLVSPNAAIFMDRCVEVDEDKHDEHAKECDTAPNPSSDDATATLDFGDVTSVSLVKQENTLESGMVNCDLPSPSPIPSAMNQDAASFATVEQLVESPTEMKTEPATCHTDTSETKLNNVESNSETINRSPIQQDVGDDLGNSEKGKSSPCSRFDTAVEDCLTHKCQNLHAPTAVIPQKSHSEGNSTNPLENQSKSEEDKSPSSTLGVTERTTDIQNVLASGAKDSPSGESLENSVIFDDVPDNAVQDAHEGVGAISPRETESGMVYSKIIQQNKQPENSQYTKQRSVSNPAHSNTVPNVTSVADLGILPDLTKTVIRQLSNYNTILKNLLVSGVGNSSTIAQLTSADSGQSEQQNKVLAALISNTMQLFKGDDSNNPLLVTSSNSDPVMQSDEEDAGKCDASTSKSLQRVTDMNEKPVIQNASAISAEQPFQVVVTSGEPATPVSSHSTVHADSSQLPPIPSKSNASAQMSRHQGLQVPIVSSSVKGSIQGEEEELEDKHEAPSLGEGEPKLPIQNEVSTSVKATEAIELPTPPIIAETNIPEKRLTRTRNATSKQKIKRQDKGGPSEKLSKRGSGSTGATPSPNTRAPQRGSGSSERQSRNVKNGDLVWGQMRGFPSWPGKVVKPSEVRGVQQRAPLSDGKVWVKWFGDHTFTQMNPADLVTMTEGLEAHHKLRKKGRTRTRKISAHLETAIQEAVDGLEQQQGSAKKFQNTMLISATAVVDLPATSETSEKPRRGRKRKAT